MLGMAAFFGFFLVFLFLPPHSRNGCIYILYDGQRGSGLDKRRKQKNSDDLLRLKPRFYLPSLYSDDGKSCFISVAFSILLSVF